MDDREDSLVIDENLTRELVDEVLHIFNFSRFSKVVGSELVALGKGRCLITCPVNSDLLNSFGYVHGGVTAALADICMGLAVATHGRKTLTAELTVNYFAPAGGGEVLNAEGRVVHQGGVLLVAECSIRGSDNRLVAIGKGLYMGRGSPLSGEKKV